MLESIEFIKPYRTFPEGQSFHLKPGLNLLVGDQGCGKSTLLNLIHSVNREVLSVERDKPTYTAFVDFEKNNPRVRAIEQQWHINAMFSSHGETNLQMLKGMKEVDSDVTILLDEPDMALSIRSIYELHELLISTPNQIICSAHNPLLIELVGEVLSLEHGKWMNSNEFIQSHKPQ